MTSQETETIATMNKFLATILTVVITLSLYILNKLDTLFDEVVSVHDTTLIMKADIQVLSTRLDYAAKKTDKLERKLSNHVNKIRKNSNTIHSWSPRNNTDR